MRQPQVRNCRAGDRAERQHRQIRQEQPGRHAELRPRGDKAAMGVGPRPFHRHQHRAAPFAADPDPLHGAQDRQDDRAPDADPGVARDKGHQEGRDPHQQQSRDQRRLAPDAVAVMTEDGGADRAGDKADGIDRKGLQGADQRIGSRKIELGEDQPGHRAVDEEIVPLDRRADRAGDHRAAQLPAVLDLGQRSSVHHSGHHGASPQTSGSMFDLGPPGDYRAVGRRRELHRVDSGRLPSARPPPAPPPAKCSPDLRRWPRG